MERNLCHNLRDNRVDLSRHDRGTVLHRRQVDLAEAGARTAGQKTQIVAHLGKVDGAGLERTRNIHKAVEVLRSIKQILRLHQRVACDSGECRNNVVEIIVRSIDGRADRGSAEIDRIEIFAGAVDAADVTLNHRCVSVEALAETHRDSVLKLCSSHFQDVVKLL